MKVAWTRLALMDVDRVYAHIAEESPRAAVRALDRIKAAVEVLRHHPEIGRPGRLKGTRELVVTGTPFIAGYRLKGSTVEVFAVIHGARRWPDSL